MVLDHSLSKLSTTIAPIDAGIVITITRFNEVIGSFSTGNLSKHSKTKATTNAVIKYASTIRKMNTDKRDLISF